MGKGTEVGAVWGSGSGGGAGRLTGPLSQVLSHNLYTVLHIPHDPVALEEHFRDDDDGPVSSQGYMPYLNKYILDKVGPSRGGTSTSPHFPASTPTHVLPYKLPFLSPLYLSHVHPSLASHSPLLAPLSSPWVSLSSLLASTLPIASRPIPAEAHLQLQAVTCTRSSPAPPLLPPCSSCLSGSSCLSPSHPGPSFFLLWAEGTWVGVDVWGGGGRSGWLEPASHLVISSGIPQLEGALAGWGAGE